MPFRAEHIRERSPMQDVVDLYWIDDHDREIFVSTLILPTDCAREFVEKVNRYTP